VIHFGFVAAGFSPAQPQNARLKSLVDNYRGILAREKTTCGGGNKRRSSRIDDLCRLHSFGCRRLRFAMVMRAGNSVNARPSVLNQDLAYFILK
jgi:hypothetical protein